MKAIFDAIRAEFAHKPRNSHLGSDTRTVLYAFASSTRGASHRIKAICDETLSQDERKLKKNFEEALHLLLVGLADLSEEELISSNIPALRIKDDTGFLQKRAMKALTRPMYGDGFTFYVAECTIEDGVMKGYFKASPNAGQPLEEFPFKWKTFGLDTLEGAALSLKYLQNKMRKEVRHFPTHPKYLAYKANKEAIAQAHKDQWNRIRNTLRGLSAQDRQACQPYASGLLRDALF